MHFQSYLACILIKDELGNHHVPSSLSRSAVAVVGVVVGRDPAPPRGTTSKKRIRDLKLHNAFIFI